MRTAILIRAGTHGSRMVSLRQWDSPGSLCNLTTRRMCSPGRSLATQLHTTLCYVPHKILIKYIDPQVRRHRAQSLWCWSTCPPQIIRLIANSLMPQFSPSDIRDGDRQESKSKQRDSPSESHAVCSDTRPSENSHPALPVRGWSEDVLGCNERSRI